MAWSWTYVEEGGELRTLLVMPQHLALAELVPPDVIELRDERPGGEVVAMRFSGRFDLDASVMPG